MIHLSPLFSGHLDTAERAYRARRWPPRRLSVGVSVFPSSAFAKQQQVSVASPASAIWIPANIITVPPPKPLYLSTNDISDSSITQVLAFVRELNPTFPVIPKTQYSILKRALISPYITTDPKLNNDGLEFVGDKILSLALITLFSGYRKKLDTKDTRHFLSKFKTNDFWGRTVLAEQLLKTHPALSKVPAFDSLGKNQRGSLCEAFLAALFFAVPGDFSTKQQAIQSLIESVIKQDKEFADKLQKSVEKKFGPQSNFVLKVLPTHQASIGRTLLEWLFALQCYEQLPDAPAGTLHKLNVTCKAKQPAIIKACLTPERLNCPEGTLNETAQALAALGRFYLDGKLDEICTILDEPFRKIISEHAPRPVFLDDEALELIRAL